MGYGGPVVFHFDVKRLVEVGLHETEHVLLIRHDLSRRIRSLKIKVEKTVGLTATEEPGNLSRVLGCQEGKIDSL
jgi:hypothetical protein